MSGLAAGSLLAKAAGSLVAAAMRKAILTPHGAGLVDRPIRLDSRVKVWEHKRTVGEDDLRKLATVLDRRLESLLDGEFQYLTEPERAAVVQAVARTFSAVTPLDAELLFETDFDPHRLNALLRQGTVGTAARAALNPVATGLYDQLLASCCTHVLEFATSRVEFERRALVELVRRTGELGRDVARIREHLVPPAESVDAAFEQRYNQAVARQLDRLQLFGVTLDRSDTGYPLSTAYLSLSVTGPGARNRAGLARIADRRGLTPGTRVEQALGGKDRILIRGGAGSGKTTLLHWLAVTASSIRFDGELAGWNGTVPIFLPLRRFVGEGDLPRPEQFLTAGAGRNLAGEMPEGWIHARLREGRALVLVDGVDEVPAALRPRTRQWLRELVSDFPHARYVVTSRPPAVNEGWLAPEGFVTLDLLPMSRGDVRTFIGHWHDAAREGCRDDREQAELDRYEEALIEAVATQRQLGRLVTNPLLCALMCALNRDRRMQLPQERKELYDAALEMLLVRRDSEREIPAAGGAPLTYTQLTLLLQKLAYWLIRNGLTDADRASVVEQIGRYLQLMPHSAVEPEAAFGHLLLRTGLLREPAQGRVDFVHRTFQDYLGAKAAVEAGDLGLLIQRAHEDQWHDVVSMAVGHARPHERTTLLSGLLDRGTREPAIRHRLHLLAAASLANAPELDWELYGRVRERAADLVPPRGMEDAEALATAGEFVLDLLPKPDGLSEEAAAATVRTAASIGGETALHVLARFGGDERAAVHDELLRAWSRFDAEEYAGAVLSRTPLTLPQIHVTDQSLLASLRHLWQVHSVRCQGDLPDLSSLAEVRGLRELHIAHNQNLADLAPLGGCTLLEELFLLDCPRIRDLSALRTVPTLRHLGLDRWPDAADRRVLAGLPGPTSLTLLRTTIPDFAPLAEVPGLSTLELVDCTLPAALSSLHRISGLRRLRLYCHGVGKPLPKLDLTPLAGLDALHVTVRGYRVCNTRHLDPNRFDLGV